VLEPETATAQHGLDGMSYLVVAGRSIPFLLVDAMTVAVAVVVALIVHGVAIHLLERVAKHTTSDSDDLLVAHARRPLCWILIFLALAFIRGSLHLAVEISDMWNQAAGVIVPGLMGWLAIALIQAGSKIVEYRNDISVADNLRARRKRTRSAILTRISVLVVGFITICLMLLSIPSIRSVGVTLMASAGIAALAVGAAAQPALKNLIAGIQMAFTEPVRLDDVLIIDGEWGRVEEIQLTYVILALWDERRLVVPVSRFLEQSFQNWTRSSSQLLGSAFLYLDPTTDIARLRGKATEVITASRRWDGRFQNLQVTDMKEEMIEVRVLATARDASQAFDLRCEIREALMAFVRDEMPEALPRRRQLQERVGSDDASTDRTFLPAD
jgi:small-conductance mechanosensitive channel